MGMLVKGVWRDVGYDTKAGEFLRNESVFRDRITADGSSGFRAEPGRYHLYVSLACPWAHRTLILRTLKGLEDAISVSIVDPYMGPDGWSFSDRPGCTPDSVNGADATARGLPEGEARLHRARHRAGALGPHDGHDRQQRVCRDHPHAEPGVQCVRLTKPAGSLSGFTAPGDRSLERSHLPDGQQWGLSGRLCHNTGQV